MLGPEEDGKISHVVEIEISERSTGKKLTSEEGETPEALSFLLINKSKFFCFLVSIRTNKVQNMFYKCSSNSAIAKNCLK